MFHKSKQNLEALFSAKEAEFHNYSRDSVVFQDSLGTIFLFLMCVIYQY